MTRVLLGSPGHPECGYRGGCWDSGRRVNPEVGRAEPHMISKVEKPEAF